MTPVGLLATGASLHLPGVRPADDLAGLLSGSGGDWAHADAVPADKAVAVLGRKGLLAKEPATRLALCAVHRALGLPAGARREAGALEARTAVVACSNLGNVGTVARVARTVEEEGGRGVSVLDAPNASSNIVASTLALWFGFGGANLMVCSGAASGADGLRLAALLLRARRADRVVLVGVEPDDEVAAGLHAAGDPERPLRAGAACVLLQTPDVRPSLPGEALIEVGWSGPVPLTVGPGGGVDPAARWGDSYGAQTVVSLALAVHLAADEGRGPVGVSGPDGGGVALVRPPALVRFGGRGAADGLGRAG